jgi:hypothetical protein
MHVQASLDGSETRPKRSSYPERDVRRSQFPVADIEYKSDLPKLMMKFAQDILSDRKTKFVFCRALAFDVPFPIDLSYRFRPNNLYAIKFPPRLSEHLFQCDHELHSFQVKRRTKIPPGSQGQGASELRTDRLA